MKIEIILLAACLSFMSVHAQQNGEMSKSQKRSQTYSLTVGVASMDKFNHLGLTSGLIANYRFNEKIGLETGLNYIRRKSISIKDNNYLFYMGLDTSYFAPAPDGFELIHTWRIDYFKTPILFTYRPHPKIQLAAGGEFAYTSGWSYEFSYNMEIDPELSTFYEARYDGHWSSIWHTSVLAGIVYFPLPRLGIDLLYRKSFQDTGNTGLQFSLRYQIIPFK